MSPSWNLYDMIHFLPFVFSSIQHTKVNILYTSCSFRSLYLRLTTDGSRPLPFVDELPVFHHKTLVHLIQNLDTLWSWPSHEVRWLNKWIFTNYDTKHLKWIFFGFWKVICFFKSLLRSFGDVEFYTESFYTYSFRNLSVLKYIYLYTILVLCLFFWLEFCSNFFCLKVSFRVDCFRLEGISFETSTKIYLLYIYICTKFYNLITGLKGYFQD